jgi:hypothetical protein
MRTRRTIFSLVLLSTLIATAAVLVLYAIPLARRRSAAKTCCCNIDVILFLANEWALDHGGVFPSNFLFLDRRPASLICVADRHRQALAAGNNVGPDSLSYEIVSPGARIDDTSNAFVRCKFHGYLGYIDGRVTTSPEDGCRRLLTVVGRTTSAVDSSRESLYWPAEEASPPRGSP